MDLQTIFHFLGIIFMGLSILILLGIVGILFYILKTMRDVHKNINEKLDDFANRATAGSNLAVDIGTAVAGSVIKKAKQAFAKNKR